MGSPILQLGNSSNWMQAYAAEASATWINEEKGSHYPIPPMAIPFLFERHIIAVFPESNAAKPWWFSAGWLEQKVQTGITVGGNPDVRAQDSQRILLNRINLSIFPKLSSTYQLNIDIPYWFSHYKVTIWEYIGPESDSTENLINQLQSDVQRIEGKIDAL